MSDITLDQVNVELTSDSSKASKGIDSLVRSLENLRTSSSGAIGGLSNLDNAIKSLMKNFSGLSSSTSSFRALNNGLKDLKNSASSMQNVKFTGKTGDLDLQKQKIEQNKQALEQMQSMANRGTNISVGTNVSDLSSKLDSLINKQNVLNRNSNLLLHGYRGARQEASGLAGAVSRVSGAFKSLEKGGKNFVKSIRPAVNIVKSAASHAKGLATSLSDTTGIKRQLKHLSKYVLALFSIRGTYAAIKAFSQSWLDSTSLAAQQLSANIDYLKFALGSAVAPIIEYIANLIYSVLKVIQTVIYILTGINIFAKAFAKNMKSAAGSAAKVNKELTLAPFDELNTIGNMSSGGGGGGGAGGVAPTFDLSEVDLKYNEWVEKLVNFFKPLVESWEKYGPDLVEKFKDTAKSVSEAIAGVWGSFEKIITNGTVYKILGNILDIIKNIADAWKDAWANNNNGDKIIQNLADAFNNLLSAIRKVTESKEFKDWLTNIIDKIRQITDKIAQINWQPLIDYLAKIGGKIGETAVWILGKIVDVVGWFVEHPQAITIIVGVIGAFLALKTVLGIGKSIGEFVGAFSNIGKIFGGTKKSADDTANSLGEIGEATSGATSIFKKFFDGLGKGAVAIAILGGIALVIKELTKLIDTFSKSGLSLKKAAGIIAASIGTVVVAFTGMMLTMKLLQPSWQSIAAAAVILGGFALVIATISKLFETFANSGLSLGGAIGLLVTVFVGLTAMMAVVAYLGPAMVAGLLPFAAVVAIISAVLGVLALTLPKILSAVSNFIKTTADALVKILITIKDCIVEILDALARDLPPILKSVDNSVSNTVNNIIKLVDYIWEKVSTVIKAVWEFMKPIIEKIIDIFGEVWTKVKEVWDNISSKIQQVIEIVRKVVGEKIETVKTKFGEIWTKVKDSWNNIKSTISTIIENVRSTIKTKIDKIKDTFGEIWTKVKEVWTNIKHKFSEKLSIKLPHIKWESGGFQTGGLIKKALETLNLPTSLPKLTVSWYAEGGFPTTGDLFIANEAGPELIGRMGNQTAVANNDQIKEGIREAAYAAMTQALSENNEGHKTEVYIGNEKVYEGFSRYQNYQNNKYGVSTVRI